MSSKKRMREGGSGSHGLLKSIVGGERRNARRPKTGGQLTGEVNLGGGNGMFNARKCSREKSPGCWNAKGSKREWRHLIDDPQPAFMKEGHQALEPSATKWICKPCWLQLDDDEKGKWG